VSIRKKAENLVLQHLLKKQNLGGFHVLSMRQLSLVSIIPQHELEEQTGLLARQAGKNFIRLGY
jgi:hypothetical protein